MRAYSDDATTHALLATDAAVSEVGRLRIRNKFRNGSLDGADIADILDILHQGDALIHLTEPFYESGAAESALQMAGWNLLSDTYTTALRRRLLSYCAVAVALTCERVPEPHHVARLMVKADEIAEERWPGGQPG